MTGGSDPHGAYPHPISSTEFLIDGISLKWTMVGDLPGLAVAGLRGVTLNNNIFMTGSILYIFTFLAIFSMKYITGGYFSGPNSGPAQPSDQILKFNKDNNTWETVGNMLMERSNHAISVVPLNDIIDFCK